MFFCHKERRNCNCWNTSEYENKLYHHNQCNHSLQSHVFLWRTKSHEMICIFFFLFLWLFLFAMVFVDEWRRLHTQAVSSFCMLLLLPSLLRGAASFLLFFYWKQHQHIKNCSTVTQWYYTFLFRDCIIISVENLVYFRIYKSDIVLKKKTEQNKFNTKVSTFLLFDLANKYRAEKNMSECILCLNAFFTCAHLSYVLPRI